MSTYVDPEEDEIFTRKTLEIAILIFSRKGNKKKKKYAEKGKRRVESKPLGKISRCGSFWLTRKGLSRLRWHTRTHGSVAHSPGMKNVAVAKGGDRERKGGKPNRRNVELSTALIVSRSGPMVWCTWVYGVLSRQGTRDQRVEEVERYTGGEESLGGGLG